MAYKFKDLLMLRAKVMRSIREFFWAQNYLEVETPLSTHEVILDAHITPWSASDRWHKEPHYEANYYLHASPEYCMKRLLCRDAKNIFQLAPAFRVEEQGAKHLPEFLLLEWYTVDLNYHELMQQIKTLILHLHSQLKSLLEAQDVLPVEMAEISSYTYREVFLEFTSLNPHAVSRDELTSWCKAHLPTLPVTPRDTLDDILTLILSERIEPELHKRGHFFIYDYPVGQAALSEVAENAWGEPVAQRFELYLCGVEIANGYQELGDKEELKSRMLAQNEKRRDQHLPRLPIPSQLFMEMEAGFPTCAGVAVGVERLLMALTGARSINDVVYFSNPDLD